jgi:DNA-binding LytR/AlgR family response regulator
MKAFRLHQPDLCLLDVHLSSEIDGIQLAIMLNDKRRVPLVFLTAFNDRDTVERIKSTGPSAYLVKPVDDRNLQSSIELAFSNFYKDSETTKMYEAPQAEHDSIFIKVKDRLTRFKLNNILYFEAYDNYAFLHTQNEKHILSVSLKQVEERLPAPMFLRTHRSYIVNLSKVDSIGHNHMKLGKTEIPIGKTYRDDLMRHIEQI